MVKSKSKKKEESVLEWKGDQFDEDFIKPSEFLANDVDNEQLDMDDGDDHGAAEREENLIDKLKSLDGKKRKRLRTEMVRDEFDVNITNNDSNSVHTIKTYELLNSLSGISEASELKKLFAKTHKRTKTLETPLPKFVSEKAQRLASYAENKKEISKWDPVVKRNRRAEQLVFPLKQPDYSMQTAAELGKNWKPETDLEKQVAELLESSENNLKDQKLLTAAEIKAIQAMNLDEIKQKREEFLKLKALQSYQESKFKRLKGIKSKKYRKILRKEREKQEEKDMEKLGKEDPLKFQEVMDRLEKQRIKERMSLKHKNTSQWAKKQSRYAKYNDQARELVQNQLDISKKLTKKVQLNVNNEPSEDEEDDKSKQGNNVDPFSNMNLKNTALANNPWMKMMSGLEDKLVTEKNTSKESDEKNGDDFSRPKAFVNKKEIEKANMKDSDGDDDDDDDLDDLIDRSAISDVKGLFEKEDSDDDAGHEQPKTTSETKSTKKIKHKAVNQVEKEVISPESTEKDKINGQTDIKKSDVNIRPLSNDNDISAFNRLDPLDLGTAPKSSSAKSDHQMTLSEAFADDDVVEEFRNEKRAIVENEKVKAIDLTKPGWGDWGGAGINPDEAKKKQLRKKKGGRRNRHKLVITPQEVFKSKEEQKQLVRRDQNLDHVIISEKKDSTIAKYQISELPHQFSSVSEFESKIAQPIGRTWNPDFKYRKMVLPKVKTKLGAIIEPIDKTDIGTSIKKKK